MAEAVKVIVRCRPMNAREHNLKCKEVLNITSNIGQCIIKNPGDSNAPPKTFTFDGAYDTNSTTEQIYADIGYPLVEGVTEGYNGTIFAYGQTGCGKSFSMQGITDPPTQRGIIPRAFDHIFETIQVSEGTKYLVHAAYLEIYNEEIRDLLGKDNRKKLELKEHPDKGVYVQGLSMHPCASVKDCNVVMEKGWKHRSTGATLMNAESSRSHSIFTIYMERCEADEKGEEHIRAAKLNLVDLAGSERQAKTGATGDRLKEATKINLSLSALGNVISALVDGKSKHIPYRDSKLTRLLQDSLGGNTKTLMVACLSPADNNYDETLSTLRYANRAKNIKNKPKINEDPKDALLREYQDEINRLKMMLRGEIPVDLDNMGGGGGKKAPAKSKTVVKEKVVEKVVHVTNEEQMEAERLRIKEEYERQMVDMREEFEAMKMSKENLQKEMSNLQEHFNHQMASVEDGTVLSPGQKAQPTKGHKAKHLNTGEQNDDSQYTMQREVQRAIHLATVKTIGEAGTVAPRTSPTAEAQNVHQEVLKRLQELQHQMVGGEQANNEEVKQRRQKKKKHVEERKQKLQEALAQQNGEDIMLGIYDNVQEELKAKERLLKREKEKVIAQQREIEDLQEEFEFDRNDYLDTIRKQEQEMKWLKSVIDKIHPCLRRDSNYVNLDRIRAHSQWDEDNQMWAMPKMMIEKTKLPPAGISPGGRQEVPSYRPQQMSSEDDYEALRSEDRYLQRLSNSTEQEMANNYFRPKRAERLLTKAQDDRSWQPRNGNASPNNSHLMNGSSNGWSPVTADPWQDEVPLTRDQIRAAQVHGQISQNDELMYRKPSRLESLPGPSAKGKKKKSRQYNMMEPL